MVLARVATLTGRDGADEHEIAAQRVFLVLVLLCTCVTFVPEAAALVTPAVFVMQTQSVTQTALPPVAVHTGLSSGQPLFRTRASSAEPRCCAMQYACWASCRLQAAQVVAHPV